MNERIIVFLQIHTDGVSCEDTKRMLGTFEGGEEGICVYHWEGHE